MISIIPGVPYMLVVLWMMNGDPMAPLGVSVVPNEPVFLTKGACSARMPDYLGAIEPKRGKVACIPGVRQ